MAGIDAIGRLLCRSCGDGIEPQELTFGNAYWVGHGSRVRSFEHPEQFIQVAAEPKYPFHKSCKLEGRRREAYDCQCIDAACNDCKFFARQGTCPKPTNPFHGANRLADEEQGGYLTGLLEAGSHFGRCLRFNKAVATTSQTCEMMPCFVHRREDTVW